MFRELRVAFVLFAVLTVITGVVYPVVVTATAYLLFPHEAKGSLVMNGKEVVGSELIGQPFEKASYFWGRPSATSPMPYNGASSSGSNLGPTNPALKDAITARMENLKKTDTTNAAKIPVELVTASASGLDPHISPAAAYYQLNRVAKERQMAPEKLRDLVDRHIEPRLLGIVGEPTINVLLLNRSLDGLTNK